MSSSENSLKYPLAVVPAVYSGPERNARRFCSYFKCLTKKSVYVKENPFIIEIANINKLRKHLEPCDKSQEPPFYVSDRTLHKDLNIIPVVSNEAVIHYNRRLHCKFATRPNPQVQRARAIGVVISKT